MIDLTTWNLSVPVGSPAIIIDTPALASGYKDEYFHADSGSLFFWAPVTGSVTKSAKYPRSELRETYADGSVHNWKFPDADNMLRASLAVNQVPSSGKVVIGQIHQYGSNEPLLKVEYQYKEKTKLGNIVAKLRPTPDQDEPTVITIAQNVPMSTRFTYTIHLGPGGTLIVNAANYQWSTKLDSAWKVKDLYFKAGVYTQDNTGYATEGGQVTFYKLSAEHAAKTAAVAGL
ncbi:polysaccharide lyase family 7 protein [Pseudomonas typographi]|uniref:Polysaccharide lyase family 7 protein n=1 Tax=Pseudomonas typographi TaxID=2715964 RepID=A0ABR7YVV9_9PSED|nr:polysaccharide lyase family 7 protein [Pseudomonas typographi]MBD1549895.1 polysaccharide lyase family 7 protein [Pseudomonas typographi]MBD1585276.1 polysaccharide lyase family 7 protein [Pseudomonas typographi]MBD1597323.1 polysaccharide lyase family 7 protein [Pseudomonas typographi]